MGAFGPAAVSGLCLGFLWGIGCSVAILYSIYLWGYRKAVEDSVAPMKSKRFQETLKKIEEARVEESAESAQK